MRARRFQASRCPGCRLHLGACMCDRLPELPTGTRVILLLHQLELYKTTNTGRLALRCLPNSAVALRGRDTGAEVAGGGAAELAGQLVPDRPRLDPRPGWLAAMARPLLLFPHPGAVPLERFCGGGPVTLIVPDATWGQALRTRRRIPDLAEIPCATLPAGLVSGYRLRHAPHPGQVSTLEAIAHALGILEGAAIRDALLEVQRVMTERTLRSRGVAAGPFNAPGS